MFASRSRKARPLRCTALVAVLFLVCSLSTGAATLRVPQEFGTISEAVEATAPGDTIEIAAGEYVENVTIETPIDLLGVPEGDWLPTIRGLDPAQPVFGVSLQEGKEFKIESVVVQTAGPGPCLRVDGQARSRTEVRGCSFLAEGGFETMCIAAFGGALTVEDSIFTGPNKSANQLDRSNGVFVGENTIGMVRSCEFTAFEDAIQTQDGAYFSVSDCTITRSVSGITVWNTGSARTALLIEGNTIRRCSVGITLTGHTTRTDISRNWISQSRERPFRISLPSQCGSDDGEPFTGSLTGNGNHVSDPDDLCPDEDDRFWPVGFIM